VLSVSASEPKYRAIIQFVRDGTALLETFDATDATVHETTSIVDYSYDQGIQLSRGYPSFNDSPLDYLHRLYNAIQCYVMITK